MYFDLIGQFVKDNRIKKTGRNPKGLSQTELSTALGYKNGQFISNVERALCSIPAKKLLVLAEVFSVDAEDIVEIKVADLRRGLHRDLGMKKCLCCGRVVKATKENITGDNELGVWFDCECENTLFFKKKPKAEVVREPTFPILVL